MTISSETNKVSISSGSTITITNLEIQSEDQVLVTKTDSNGTESTLVLTTDYTVNTALDTVTLNVALGVGETATATLNVAITQGTDYVNTSALNSETVESALDKLTLIHKENAEQFDRALQTSISETGTLGNIPSLTSSGDKYLKRNSANTGWELITLSSTGGLGNLVEDTTPQLGGNLDLNSNVILDLTFADSTDSTIQGTFDLSGGTTAKTVTLISSHTDNRSITLPDATDTLVGKATTDTLTNKTIDADGAGNVISNIGSSEIKSELITGQSDTTIAVGDSIIYSDADDSGNLKKDTVQGIVDLVGAASAASQAEQEAASESGKYVAPATQQFHPSSVKAWVNFDSTSTLSVTSSYNMTSVTDNGVGDFDLVIATDFSDTTYITVGQAGGNVGSGNAIAGLYVSNDTIKIAGTVSVATSTNAGAVDRSEISAVLLGDQ